MKKMVTFFEVESKINRKNRIETFKTLFEAMASYREKKEDGADFLALMKITKERKGYSSEYLRIEG